MHPATFSIVAHDPSTGSFGVAVQSKFLAVGSVVPWASAGAGALATQAWANTSYGPRGLELLREGWDAEEVVRRLTEADPDRAVRQIGVVDRQGRAFAYTGSQCMDWAGHVVGEGFCCQGNILAGSQVVEQMAQAYRSAQVPFAERLVAALAAGQEAGGDRRGQQSAALLVVCEGGGYGRWNDRAVDLRVDDHPRPIEELRRLLAVHQLYFSPLNPADAVPLEGEVRAEVATHLARLGLLVQGVSFEEALHAFHGRENFEDRIHGPGLIDRPVLQFLRQLAQGR